MKKKILGISIALVVVLVLAIGMMGSGAWWTSQTQAVGNELNAGTFKMTIGGTGTDTVSGACVYENMAPGDDPVECLIPLKNEGSRDINVVWSGFTLTGDTTMQDWIFVTGFSDSNGTTQLSDIMGFAGADGKLSLKEAAGALNNGYFSDPNNVNNYTSVVLAPGEEGWVKLNLAFGADAPNATIGKMVGFTWSLQGRQLPKNATP